MLIQLTESDSQILECFPVLAQLRPHLKQENFLEQVQRFDAHRFYLRQRMNIASHHFSLNL